MATMLLISFMTCASYDGAMISTLHSIHIWTSKLEEKAPRIWVSLIDK